MKVHDLLSETEYPITTEQLIERHGNQTLTLGNSTETLGEILATHDSETFERPDDAVLAIYSAVDEGAIGRKEYSDRDPTPLGSPYGPDQVSF